MNIKKLFRKNFGVAIPIVIGILVRKIKKKPIISFGEVS